MKHRAVSASQDRSKWGPLQIAVGYLLLGALWILFSDRLAARIAPNANVLSQISIYKGWGYVLVTAILLYWLISRYTKTIKDANEKYKLIAENSSDVIWLYDPNQNKLNYISPSVLRLRGYTAEEVLSQPLSASFRSEDFERLSRLNQERFSLFQAKGSGTVSYADEIVYLHRDGSLVSTEATTTYFFNSQNEIEVIGVTRDITQRKQAEKKLRESEKRFQELIEQASDGIFVADATGRYTLVNEEGCHLVGYTKDEVLSLNMRDLIAPEELEDIPLRVDELHSGKTVRSQRQLVRKDESRIICEISGKMLTDGSFQSIVRDITERKITEDALVRSEKRYHSLFENMMDGYARCQMLYDEQGKAFDFIYLDVNYAFKKITGLKDVVGKRVSEVIADIHRSNPDVLATYDRVATTGQSEQFETYLPGVGSGIWLSVSAYSSEKGFFVTLFETITERKRAEESLRQSYKQLLSFIEQAPLSVAMFDHNMNYLAVSHRWIHDYGRGCTMLVGLNHYDVNPDISDSWREAHQKGLAGEIVKNDDDIWIQNDGIKNWLKWAIAPWKNEHGEIGGIIISAEDISERKRAEANAFKSELRYHRVLDAMMEGCQIISFDWKYVYVNDVVAKQGRNTPQQLLNHTMMEIYPGIEQTELFVALRRCMEDREPRRMENQFIFPDGSIGWFELSIQPADEGIFILSTDITERKQTEIALRQSEENFSKAFLSSPVALIITRLTDGHFLELNDAYCSVVGFQREELIGHRTTEFNIYIDPADRQTIIDQLQSKGSVRDFETKIRHRSGTIRDVMANQEMITISGERCILTSILDITERKRVERNIQESERRYRELVQNANSAIIRWKRDGSITFFNEYAQSFFGYSPQEILSRDVNILVPPTESTGGDISKLAENIVNSPELFVNMVNENICRDGRRAWMAWTNKPIYDENNQVTEILAVGTDITERKQAEEEVRRLNEELEARVIERTSQLAAANKELESFSYSVSHDLRAPLRAIDGYTNILLEDYEPILDEEGKRICGIISRETKRMGRLIDDLLSFSRTGRREVYFQRIDMKAMVDSVFDELLRGVDRSRIDIHVGDLLSVAGDSALLRQVWVNLLSNAIKFTSKKTRALIEVNSDENEEGVLYSVRDNGAGFEMEYANKLFGVFQRLHSESEFEGTGVGLAIVQRVIHRHGGRIWADSKVNEGTTFHFVLPQRSDQT